MPNGAILLHELAYEANTGGPYFSPHCLRARLAFALKHVDIQTVEAS